MSNSQNHTLNTSFKLDRSLFRKLSLFPFFAFIGLGADSVSSSCYGPSEFFLALIDYPHLSLLVAALAILTIWVVSTSYCQIIDLFPHGGGGYVVASKLLSPTCGLISGSALLVDYILTITVSVASGVDALFSLLPHEHQIWNFSTKILLLMLITGINLRGVKESIFPWIPVFALFALTHIAAFLWAFLNHSHEFTFITNGLFIDIDRAHSSLGALGMLLLLLRSYSVGAGTYTGIEAVSNGINLLHEPKTHNARITMLYMSIALAVTVTGLVVCYILYEVAPAPGLTLNGVLMHKISIEMDDSFGPFFCGLTLFSEAALLMMAAQSGFLGGPRVLANMAADRWMPSKFSNLSDRFVMNHGILLMGIAALLLMLYTKGDVAIIVILYSLSVFITFTLSQLGMCVHWAKERAVHRAWLKGLLINSVGFFLVFFILISLCIVKFEEGA
ncbi:MAG: amino acid permease, partial [Verrucomicrobia bacterium]|nr:amino acid permease [Verrucomicrobiota bacterium]